MRLSPQLRRVLGALLAEPDRERSAYELAVDVDVNTTTVGGCLTRLWKEGICTRRWETAAEHDAAGYVHPLRRYYRLNPERVAAAVALATQPQIRNGPVHQVSTTQPTRPASP